MFVDARRLQPSEMKGPRQRGVGGDVGGKEAESAGVTFGLARI